MSYSEIVSYSWDFGDGDTSDQQNTNHSFAVGYYTVTLTVTNADGATAFTTIFIKAYNNYPAITSSWNFDDGWTSTKQNPTHVFYWGKVHTVTYSVTNGIDTESDTETITVTSTTTENYPKSRVEGLDLDLDRKIIFPNESGETALVETNENPLKVTVKRDYMTTAKRWQLPNTKKTDRDTVWTYWDNVLVRGERDCTLIDHRKRMLFGVSWNDWKERWKA